MTTGTENDAMFRDALQGLDNGDFSRLEALFDDEGGRRPARIVEWHQEGRFRDEPKALAEALTCACFLGRTGVATYLLTLRLDPSGGEGTGLNAFHWAANRGQLETVRLLIRWKARFEPRSMYGGNVLDTAVWSAINEPRPSHLPIIEELLVAGARLENEKWPTGHEQVDAILNRHLSAPQIRFVDGAAYERYMGKWSQLAGEMFLDWLAPQPGWRWLDVGCGNGAFTEMLVERCAPVSVQGIDPSEGQLAFARTRPASRVALFREGDAMALPFPDDTFDAAVMPLVIFFVPDPARGVAEMARVVCPDGIVAAYAWDMVGGGFPYEALQAEMRGLGVAVPVPPSRDASRIDAMRDLWTGAGLDGVETKEISVQRRFTDFDDYWATIFGGPSVGPQLAAMASADLALLKARMRARLPADATGRITCSARANAVKGRA